MRLFIKYVHFLSCSFARYTFYTMLYGYNKGTQPVMRCTQRIYTLMHYVLLLLLYSESVNAKFEELL